MFPVVQPGGLDSGTARRIEPAGLGATVGVQAVTLDPHAPRAAAPPVEGPQAQATRIRTEPQALLDPAAQRLAADALAGAGGGNRAATVAPQLQWLLQCLQQLGLAEDGGAAPVMVRWPAADQPVADTPDQALQALRDTLGRSPLFAANPRTPAELARAAERAAAMPAASGSATALASGSSLVSASRPGAAGTENAAPAAAFSALPATAPGGGLEQTQQALQLLLHGQLQWAGQLTPGVPARLQREDAWQEDPQRPGKLRRGSALRLQIDLPATGPLVVLAQQFGSQVSVRLLPGARHAGRFEAALSDLQAALASLSETPVDLSLQAVQP